MIGGEAQLGIAQGEEGAHHEAGSNEQSEGEGDFRDDEAIAPEGLAFAGAGGGGSFAEAFLGGDAGGVPGRGEAEEQRGNAGGEEEEGEDAGVDVNIFSVKQGTGQVFLEQAESHEGDAEAGGGASNGEEQAFREELTGDAAALSPERAADGDFAAAAVGSGEHQSGDVGAGDEPHGENGPIESKERRTRSRW